MNTSRLKTDVLWKGTPLVWAVLALSAIALAIPFYDGISVMIEWWLGRPEFSHGILLPFIAAFLIWQKKNELETIKFEGSYCGVIIVLLGVAMYVAGELSSLYIIVQYGFWITLLGLAWSYLGSRAMQITWAAWFILFLMIPLPNFITWNLSAKLQLISSEIGVAVIRLFGISVNLEGNVIDLGMMKLQVVEACSGLRYLFPLMTLGVIVGYFFNGALWQRVFLFLSSMPITVLMNSFRIGVIGVTVEYWGKSMAEGFLHDFEGWVVFMASFAVMLLEMWVFLKISNDRRSLSQAFAIDWPEPTPKAANSNPRQIPSTLILALIILIIAASFSAWLPTRNDIIPLRKSFFDFPRNIADWRGSPQILEREYIDALHLSDYTNMDYRNPKGDSISFYSAWYDSQKKGRSAHSPKTCLPGHGWVMTEFGQKEFSDLVIGKENLTVNRAIIEQGNEKQLVYYWFQQRGRIITNEYLVKWYLFIDSLTRNRSDGALVRLVMPVPSYEKVEDVEVRTHDFIQQLVPILNAYIPN